MPSGANIVLFSTGKGATSGNVICPVIKISSTTEIYKKMPKDIDFNAGGILDCNSSMEDASRELFKKIIKVASGEKTWSEKWKLREFQIWTAGKVPL